MPGYRIVWAIDLDADSPEAAAKQARQIQLDPNSIATVFDCYEQRKGKRAIKHTVDLTGGD